RSRFVKWKFYQIKKKLLEENKMNKLTKIEATKIWVQAWNRLPIWVIEKMIGDNYEIWENITQYEETSEEENGKELFPMWPTLLEMQYRSDGIWVLENLDKGKGCGIDIYKYDDGENDMILLGVDGAGYDFYEEHWLPLYNKRGFNWHQ